jgi:DNA-binding SARP family transcriptional activator/tetratricopeptide (TPR) repeat protein
MPGASAPDGLPEPFGDELLGSDGMRFGVLGSLLVTDDGGGQVDVGGQQPRVVVTALVAAGGGPVSADGLIEAIWGEEPPRSAAGTLQTYVSRLRRVLSEHGGPTLVLDDAGYRMDLSGHEVDAERFGQLAAEGEMLLSAQLWPEGRDALAGALALWRGPALSELVERGHGLAQAAALDERRMAVLERRIDADLALGRDAVVVAELQALVGEHPLREGLQATLALALYRSGRQADALRSLASAGRMLRDELGLEPSRQLVDLEAAILAHDPALDLPAGAVSAPSVAARGADPSAAAGDGRVPVVGRDTDLAELRAALAEAADDARFVVVEGEAGIGKTRLADELATLAAAHGSVVVWGRCDETGAAPALWPWLPVVREVVAAAAEELPPLVGELLTGSAPLLAGQGAAVQFQRFDAIATALEAAGADRPVVVVLDDLQWADAGSLDLLQFLATRHRRGVLVVATVRTPGVGVAGPLTDALATIARRSGSRRLRLRGLSAEGTRELLAAVVADPVTAELATRIHERAEGNPFYAIELVRLAEDDGGEEVPASVRDVVKLRLREVPAVTASVLTVAAVVGREVDLPLLATATGLDLADCLDRLDPAAEQRLLVPSPESPGALRFSHALVREVLVDELTPLRRGQIHLAVADAMAVAAGGDDEVPRDEVEVFAEHLWRSVALGAGPRAAAALERAAETAISRVAYAQAEEALARAARLRRSAGSDPDSRMAELATLLRLLEVMQATRYFAGTDQDVLARAQDLAAAAGLDDVGRTLAWSGWAALSSAGRLAEARPLAESFLDRWGDDDRLQVRAAAHVMFGVDEWTRGRVSSAIVHLDRAIALMQDAPPPSNAFEAEYAVIAHAFALWSHAAHGDLSVDDAHAGFDGLLAVVPPFAVPGVCAFAGAVASVHGRWDDLERYVRRALDADDASQFAFFGGQLLMQRGVVEAAGGHLDDGVASFLEGRRRYRAVGGRTMIVTYQSLVAELLGRAGRTAEATELAAGARRQVDVLGMGWEEIPLLVCESVVAHGAGDHRRAVERMAAAVRVAEEDGCEVLARRAEATAAELGIELSSR